MWVDRFWSKVAKGHGCWLWTAARANGYGRFWHPVLRRQMLAHRVSAALAGQPIDGLIVMHTCDVPACVNPAHLRSGTHRDNSRDMSRKRRGNTVKLTEANVLDARRRAAAGEPIKSIAKSIGVAFSTAQSAITGLSWAHLPNAVARRGIGATHHASKLTDADARAIRARGAAGETGAALGREYGVSKVAACHIIAGRTWRHLAP